MKESTVEIEGAIWAIRPVRRGDMQSPHHDGECDHEQLTIRVYRDLPPPAMVETIIHEIMHAQQPDLSEDAITRRAREITRALVKTKTLKRWS